MFALVVCALLYYGGCDCKEGFSENDPTYYDYAFNTDNCNPGAFIEEKFTYDCGTLKKVNKTTDDNNKYIYDLFKKYKKLELDNFNYKSINNIDTIGTLCNCDVTGAPWNNRRFGEDIKNCGITEEGGQICDCLYSDEVVKDGRTLKTGTCAAVGKWFDGDEIKLPPNVLHSTWPRSVADERPRRTPADTGL